MDSLNLARSEIETPCRMDVKCVAEAFERISDKREDKMIHRAVLFSRPHPETLGKVHDRSGRFVPKRLFVGCCTDGKEARGTQQMFRASENCVT